MSRVQLIKVRRDTAANWSSANPVLALGEPGYDTTNGVEKIGDGVTAWNSLAAVGAAALALKANLASPALTGSPTLNGSAFAAAATMTTAQIAADSALTDAFGPILNVQLLAWTLAQAFRVVSATRDANDAITTASVVWPDGSTGTFTTDTASTAFPGAIDAYHVTYVNATTGTKTVTQTAVTRNANGAVTAQPALTVA